MARRLVSKNLGFCKMDPPRSSGRNVCCRHALGSGFLDELPKFDQFLVLKIYMRAPSGAGGETFTEDVTF